MWFERILCIMYSPNRRETCLPVSDFFSILHLGYLLLKIKQVIIFFIFTCMAEKELFRAEFLCGKQIRFK